MRKSTWVSMFVVVVALATATGCDDENKNKGTEGNSKTVISGHAPLNGGGTARALRLQDGGWKELVTGKIADDGSFRLELGYERGIKNQDMVIEAKSGGFSEPATGQPVNMDDMALHAILHGVEVFEHRSVTLNPWQELLYVAGGDKDAHAKNARLLDEALGCQARGLVNAKAAVPAANRRLEDTNTESLAYLHLAGWSQAAHLMGEGITTKDLLRAVAQDLSDGVLDGFADGHPVLVQGVALAQDFLRQPFAQAVRQFVRDSREAPPGSERGRVVIREEALLEDLKCMSSAPQSLWGPEGTVLDLEGPKVTIDLPNDGTLISDQVASFSCTAEGASPIANLEAIASQIEGGQKVVRDVLLPNSPEGLGGKRASLRTTMGFGYAKTGPVAVTCTATDRWGIRGTGMIHVELNKGAPKPRLSVDPITPDIRGNVHDVPRVAGIVKVSCACENTYPAEERPCGLSDDSWHQGLAENPEMKPSAAYAEYTWDTRQVVVDGVKELTCEARTPSFPAATDGKQVRVTNRKQVTVHGQVYMEGPVPYAQVTAHEYKAVNGALRVGARVDTGTAEIGGEAKDAGRFQITLTNEYRGPVIFVAERSRKAANAGRQAFLTSLTSGLNNKMNNHVLELILEHYEPGVDVPAITISGASSLAASYTKGLFAHGDSRVKGNLIESIQQAHQEMFEYIAGGADLRHEPGISPNADHLVPDDPSTLLALWHVGLSQLACEKGYDAFSSNAWELITKLCHDALDGKMDGRRPMEPPILAIDTYPITANTLRADMAHAIHRWLARKGGRGLQRPLSSLDAESFIGKNRFLDRLARSRANLFGGAAPGVYDSEPPKVTVKVSNASGEAHWRKLPMGRPIKAQQLLVLVEADAASGITDIAATYANGDRLPLPARPGEVSTGKHKGQRMFWVDVQPDASGVLEIEITVINGVMVSCPATYSVLWDNVVPTLSVDKPTVIVNSPNVVLKGSVSKPFAHIRVFRAVSEIADLHDRDYQPARHRSTPFEVTAQVECDRETLLGVVAEDFAGNQSAPQQVRVICDCQAPKVELLERAFAHDFGGGTVRIKTGEAPPTFRKLIARLDVNKDHNVPTIAVRVDDHVGGGPGSIAENIRVKWRYEFRGSTEHKRDWEPFHPSQYRGAGIYELELGYQHLLPHDILPLSNDEASFTEARKKNFIARATADDEHKVFIQAFDEAGNPSEELAFTFHLDLRSAPLVMDCAPVADFQSARLVSETGLSKWSEGAGVPMFSTTYSWDLRGEEDSLAPNVAKLRVTAKPTSVVDWHVIVQLANIWISEQLIQQHQRAWTAADEAASRGLWLLEFPGKLPATLPGLPFGKTEWAEWKEVWGRPSFEQPHTPEANDIALDGTTPRTISWGSSKPVPFKRDHKMQDGLVGMTFNTLEGRAIDPFGSWVARLRIDARSMNVLRGAMDPPAHKTEANFPMPVEVSLGTCGQRDGVAFRNGDAGYRMTFDF